MKAWAWRLALVGVAAVVIPACNSTNTTTLFQDFFNGADPATNWTLGTPAPVKDTLNGSGTPPASLLVSGSGTQTPTALAKTTFDATAITFSVEMAADTNEATGTDVGVGSITILDTFAAPVASATWDAASGGRLTVDIQGTSFKVAAPAADLAFHRLKFTATASGKASWSLDNGTALVSSTTFFPITPLSLQLGATYPAGPGFALFYFDNVSVTSP